MKIVSSKKDMSSVMNHRGFGDVVIYKKGFKVIVPSKLLSHSGEMKKSVTKLLNNFTVGNALCLMNVGVAVTVA